MISLAIIGTGTIAPSYLQAIDWLRTHRGLELQVVAAVNRSRESNLRAKEMGIPRTYTSIAALLENEKPDGIIVAVSAFSIFSVTRELIPHGIPLLVEKPPGMTSEQAGLLSSLAEQYQTTVMVGFNRRFYSVVRQAKGLVEQSGGLLGMRMDGFERYRLLREQHVDPLKLDSLFTTNSIHCIDLIRYYTGEPKQVTVFDNRQETEPYNHRYAALIVSQRDVPVTFQAYWHAVGNWSYELYIPDGKIQFVNLEEAYVHFRNKEPYRLEPDEADMGAKPGFAAQLQHFADLILENRYYKGQISIHDAVHTMSLVERLQRSQNINTDFYSKDS